MLCCDPPKVRNNNKSARLSRTAANLRMLHSQIWLIAPRSRFSPAPACPSYLRCVYPQLQAAQPGSHYHGVDTR